MENMLRTAVVLLGRRLIGSMNSMASAALTYAAARRKRAPSLQTLAACHWDIRMAAIAVVASLGYVGLTHGAHAATCPFGNSLPDGCAGVGNIKAGNQPTMLDPYTPGEPGYQMGWTRGNWNAAGVDYYVGETGRLADPTTATLPTGCYYRSGTVSCGGDNVTISGYNFGTHGTQLQMTGANPVVTNNKFGYLPSAPCNDPLLYIAGSGNQVISKNTFDGSGGDAGCSLSSYLGTVIYAIGSAGGSISIYYNNIYRSPQHGISVTGSTDPTGIPVVVKWNLFNIGGFNHTHADLVQYDGGNFSKIDTEYNTGYNAAPGGIGVWTQFWHIESQLGAKIASSTEHHNTGIAKSDASPQCDGGNNYQSCVTNYIFACKLDGGQYGGVTNNHYVAQDNYADINGAVLGFINSGCPSVTWGGQGHENINMRTSRPLPQN